MDARVSGGLLPGGPIASGGLDNRCRVVWIHEFFKRLPEDYREV